MYEYSLSTFLLPTCLSTSLSSSDARHNIISGKISPFRVKEKENQTKNKVLCDVFACVKPSVDSSTLCACSFLEDTDALHRVVCWQTFRQKKKEKRKSDGHFKRFAFQMSDFHFVNIKALLDRRLAADLQWQLRTIARTQRSKRHQKKTCFFSFFYFFQTVPKTFESLYKHVSSSVP